MVIGTMKSGSTSLFRWLESHPAVSMPATKEPNFFCDDRRFRHGMSSYLRYFADCPLDQVTGEASVQYTDPRWSERTAFRVRHAVPSVKLICLLRNPFDRMRSHYLHEVQRGREARRFSLVASELNSPYVQRSCYALALEPWVRLFPPEQLRVVSFEELFSADSAWSGLLDFLELGQIPRPAEAHNVGADKAAFSRPLKILWEAGVVQRLPSPPRALRSLARRALLKPPHRTSHLVASAKEPVSQPVRNLLIGEVQRLAVLIPTFDHDWEKGFAQGMNN